MTLDQDWNTVDFGLPESSFSCAEGHEPQPQGQAYDPRGDLPLR